MRSPSNVIRIFACLWLLLALGVPALSQTTTGRIVGTVHDQSGAAMPNATVSITDVQRGLNRTVTTDDAGGYVVPSLDPGIYKVRAKSRGFKTVERPNIQVEVASDVTIDMSLPPGDVKETVVDHEDVPLDQHDFVYAGRNS